MSLEVKQQCIVPSEVHFYEDKLWSYIVTKNVDEQGCDLYLKFLRMQLSENMTPFRL